MSPLGSVNFMSKTNSIEGGRLMVSAAGAETTMVPLEDADVSISNEINVSLLAASFRSLAKDHDERSIGSSTSSTQRHV